MTGAAWLALCWLHPGCAVSRVRFLTWRSCTALTHFRSSVSIITCWTSVATVMLVACVLAHEHTCVCVVAQVHGNTCCAARGCYVLRHSSCTSGCGVALVWMPYVTGQYVGRSVGVPGWFVVHGDKAVCSSARAWVRLVQCVIKNFKIIRHTNGTPYPANAVCEQCGNVRCWPTCLEPTSTYLECCGIKL